VFDLIALQIGDDAQKYYLQFIAGLKSKAQSRIFYYKGAIRSLQEESAEFQRVAAESLESAQVPSSFQSPNTQPSHLNMRTHHT
jgi:hypothetical protein